MNRADVAVIGAGIVGLSTASALKQRGVSVCCFERGVPGRAQSAGQTRIFRHRHDSDEMVRLALRARGAWRDLEERARDVLVGDEGVLMIGMDQQEANRLAELGVTVEELDREALQSRVPLGDGHISPEYAILDMDGGAIRADRAIAALARDIGDRLITTDVFRVAPHDEFVAVDTSEGMWTCASAVIAAGADTRRLASDLGISIPEDRALHVRASFETRGQKLPCLLDRSGLYGENVYASPADDGRILAIGLSSADNSLPLDADDRLSPNADPEALEGRIQHYANAALPTLVGRKLSTRLCMTTPLKLGDDMIATWRLGPITLIAGNNLFKFAPLLGSLLADSVEGRELHHVLQPQIA